MKTAMQEVMDEIEMEHNNGVEISQKQLWKMLLKAKEKEKEQIIDAVAYGFNDALAVCPDDSFEQYYNETFNNHK